MSTIYDPISTAPPIPTEQQIDAAWEAALARLDQYAMTLEYTIEDYPIGGSNRGKCKLAVGFNKGHGFRTVRTTTNRRGAWCKPHASTYQEHPIVVVVGCIRSPGELTGAWLRLCPRTGPYLQMANGDNEPLCAPPHYCRPRRENKEYRLTINGVPETNADGTPKVNVLYADPPALCDAWDRWWDHYKRLAAKVIAFHKGEVAR